MSAKNHPKITLKSRKSKLSPQITCTFRKIFSRLGHTKFTFSIFLAIFHSKLQIFLVPEFFALTHSQIATMINKLTKKIVFLTFSFPKYFFLSIFDNFSSFERRARDWTDCDKRRNKTKTKTNPHRWERNGHGVGMNRAVVGIKPVRSRPVRGYRNSIDTSKNIDSWNQYICSLAPKISIIIDTLS